MHSIKRNRVFFSTVWEDIKPVKKALNIKPTDIVLNISSAGDNTFNLLLENPSKVISIDVNPQQISLSLAKKLALEHLNHNALLALLEGADDNLRFFQQIDDLLNTKDKLSRFLAPKDVRKGLNNIGIVESKILPFSPWLLRRLITDTNVFVKTDLALQKQLYLKNKLPRCLVVTLLTHKSLYRPFMPQLNNETPPIRQEVEENLKTCFEQNDFSQNFYLQKLFYRTYKVLPPFLKPANRGLIVSRLPRVEWIAQDLLSYLEGSASESIDKMNLSDIFDWCTRNQTEAILKTAHRALKTDGIVFYRELFIKNSLPDSIKSLFRDTNQMLATKYCPEDRSPVYHTNVILKK